MYLVTIRNGQQAKRLLVNAYSVNEASEILRYPGTLAGGWVPIEFQRILSNSSVHEIPLNPGDQHMSAYERYQAAASRPEPKPLTQLTREQIAARVHVLREAVHALWTQHDLDGGEHYESIAWMKKDLIMLEEELQRRDRPEPVPTAPLPPDLAAIAQVTARLAADPNISAAFRKELDR